MLLPTIGHRYLLVIVLIAQVIYTCAATDSRGTPPLIWRAQNSARTSRSPQLCMYVMSVICTKTVLPRAQVKQIGGMVKYLRENKVLATPLENNDQSAFIARSNIISSECGGGGHGW